MTQLIREQPCIGCGKSFNPEAMVYVPNGIACEACAPAEKLKPKRAAPGGPGLREVMARSPRIAARIIMFILVGGSMALFLLCFGVYRAYQALIHMDDHADIHVVNTTGKDGVSVFVDGKLFGQNLKNAANEDFGLAAKKSISPGQHKIEAKDADGKVVESISWRFSESQTYLYAPARAPNVCFFAMPDSRRLEPYSSTMNIYLVPGDVENSVLHPAACNDPKLQR